MSEYECVRKQQKNQSITLHQSEVAFLGKQIIQKPGFACELSFLSTPPHPHYTTLLHEVTHVVGGKKCGGGGGGWKEANIKETWVQRD